MLFSPSSLNFLGLDHFESALKTAKYIIIPVPYDSTVTYRPGSRNGPYSILKASRNLELFDIELQQEPHLKGVFTLNEIEPVRGNVQATLDVIHEITKQVFQLKKIPVFIGGEHTITIGAVRALPQDVMVVVLDAHSDLRDTYLGDSYCHATVMRRILDQGKKIVEIGVRSMSRQEFQFVNETGLPVFYSQAFKGKDVMKVWKDIHHLIGGKKVYLSIDIDVFDPSEAPGVSTPEPDGLHFGEIKEIIKNVCDSSKIVGLDVVEVTPIPGNVITEFLAAKILYKTLGYMH